MQSFFSIFFTGKTGWNQKTAWNCLNPIFPAIHKEGQPITAVLLCIFYHLICGIQPQCNNSRREQKLTPHADPFFHFSSGINICGMIRGCAHFIFGSFLRFFLSLRQQKIQKLLRRLVFAHQRQSVFFLFGNQCHHVGIPLKARPFHL